MPDNTRDLHPNTIAFSCLEPEAAILIVDVILAVASVLHWRQSAKSLLIEILCRVAESDSFECGHIDFSAAIWPYLTDSARKEKFSKWLKKLKEDMKLSVFPAVKIAPPRHKKMEDGAFVGLPTLYQRGAFWGLFRDVQDRALECDLMTLSVRPRRAKVRVIVSDWLNKYGAKPIVRERKEKSERGEREQSEAKTPKPCSCGCAMCAHCERSAKEKPVVQVAERRVDKASVAKRISDVFTDILYECGQDWMNLGFSVGSFEVQIDKEREMTSERLRLAMQRANKSGLRLVGGQPK